jgi:hypothetical protein
MIYKDFGYGLMDISGKIIIDGFDEAKGFSEGFVRVKINKEPFLLDMTGRFLTDASGNDHFPGIRSFSDGIAAYDSGYVLKTGERVLMTTAAHTDFRNGWAAIQGKDKWWYIIDKTGTYRDSIRTKYNYDQLMNLGHGYFLAGVLDGKSKRTIYNTAGEIMPLTYEMESLLESAYDFEPFVNGIARFGGSDWRNNPEFHLVDTMLNQIFYGFGYCTQCELRGIAGPTAEFYFTPEGEKLVRKFYAKMDGGRLTTEEGDRMLEVHPKIKAVAIPNLPLSYLGQGFYKITLVEDHVVGNKGVVMDTTGRVLMQLGRQGSESAYIWDVENFVDGFALFRTANKQPLTAEEIAERMAERARRSEEAYQRDQATINTYLYGNPCDACKGTGRVDTTPTIQVINEFGRTVSTESSKVKTRGVCSKCSGHGRIKGKL